MKSPAPSLRAWPAGLYHSARPSLPCFVAQPLQRPRRKALRFSTSKPNAPCRKTRVKNPAQQAQ
jgi:hypothetical protein